MLVGLDHSGPHYMLAFQFLVMLAPPPSVSLSHLWSVWEMALQRRL